MSLELVQPNPLSGIKSPDSIFTPANASIAFIPAAVIEIILSITYIPQASLVTHQFKNLNESALITHLWKARAKKTVVEKPMDGVTRQSGTIESKERLKVLEDSLLEMLNPLLDKKPGRTQHYEKSVKTIADPRTRLLKIEALILQWNLENILDNKFADWRDEGIDAKEWIHKHEEDCSDQTEINLSNQCLTFLPPEIRYFTNLISLKAENCQLMGLSSAIGNLTRLHLLILSNNKLAFVPSQFGELKAVEIHLDHNNLSSLPAEIGKLERLRKLNLSNNKISVLPSEIANNVKLMQLDLSHNLIAVLPKEMAKLTQLWLLKLSGNPIEQKEGT